MLHVDNHWHLNACFFSLEVLTYLSEDKPHRVSFRVLIIFLFSINYYNHDNEHYGTFLMCQALCYLVYIDHYYLILVDFR